MSERERNEEARYTPGPWGWSDQRMPGDDARGWWVEGPGAAFVAETLKEADARLIAAAPYLLEALRALVLVTEDDFDETPNEWTHARDAIAKATNSDRGGMTE